MISEAITQDTRDLCADMRIIANKMLTRAHKLEQRGMAEVEARWFAAAKAWRDAAVQARFLADELQDQPSALRLPEEMAT